MRKVRPNDVAWIVVWKGCCDLAEVVDRTPVSLEVELRVTTSEQVRGSVSMGPAAKSPGVPFRRSGGQGC